MKADNVKNCSFAVLFLKEMAPSPVHLRVECLEALHRVVVGVFGQIVDPGFKNDISTFEKKFMGAM